MALKDSVDRAQQERRRLAIAVATLKKYSEDGSSYYAGVMAFWAFFSLFPLLLVGITVVGYVLPADTKAEVLKNVGDLLPLVDVGTVGSLSGAWWVLVVGGTTALWSGTAVVRTAQVAFDSVWEIPHKDLPGLVEKTLRGIAALSTIGVGLVAATVVSSFVTGDQSAIDLGWWGRPAGYAISLVLDVGLFVLAFRILTSRGVTFRDVLPGALLAGGAFFVLQQVSSLIISRYLKNAEDTYGNFATVITILWWFYLEAQLTMLGAQLNVVLKTRLYPRSLFGPPEQEADRRALEAYAEEATYSEREEVDARFHEDPDPRRPR